jgi:thymidine phosphorylase
MSVQDLINAIATGNATETQDAFQAVMAEKISARLDDMRVQVAQNMFKEGYSSKNKMKEEDECDDKDEKEMDEELNLEENKPE